MIDEMATCEVTILTRTRGQRTRRLVEANADMTRTGIRLGIEVTAIEIGIEKGIEMVIEKENVTETGQIVTGGTDATEMTRTGHETRRGIGNDVVIVTAVMTLKERVRGSHDLEGTRGIQGTRIQKMLDRLNGTVAGMPITRIGNVKGIGPLRHAGTPVSTKSYLSLNPRLLRTTDLTDRPTIESLKRSWNKDGLRHALQRPLQNLLVRPED